MIRIIVVIMLSLSLVACATAWDRMRSGASTAAHEVAHSDSMK